MKGSRSAWLLVLLGAATQLCAAEADVVGVLEAPQFTIALKNQATGVCKKAPGWRDAFKLGSFGRQPGCWLKNGDRVKFCFSINGKLDPSCMYLPAKEFVEPQRSTFE